MALKEDGVHFCPKQGNKIEGVVLNRVCIVGFFCPKQGQGIKPSAAQITYTQLLVEYPLGLNTNSPKKLTLLNNSQLNSVKARDLKQGQRLNRNLIAYIWTRSICKMQTTFPGVEFLRISSRFKKRKENSSSNVHVLHKASN